MTYDVKAHLLCQVQLWWTTIGIADHLQTVLPVDFEARELEGLKFI